MDRITVYEELRLIERSEREVSTAWKGAHLLLFFLAFVFGSFCTFCFNVLMYLFDEKCVLYPKIISLNSLRHNVIYEFLPQKHDKSDPLPVDFLSTQFVHKSACYLPTYVPLVSGIFGLVWTTMFIMCSSGSRSLSGLQRPWRVVVPVLLFSVAMSCLCIYTSAVTHYGLMDLCLKLGEVTGSKSCTYSVNVATLAYEHHIRGVYQATRLTITAAWMHTGCWVASALLALVRILLAVDFRLVKIRAELVGDVDRLLEQHEEHLHTVMPTRFRDDDSNESDSQVFSYFKNEKYENVREFGQLIDVGSDILFISEQPVLQSNEALLSEERNKSHRSLALEAARKEHRFIVTIVYDILSAVEHEISSCNSSPTPSRAEIIPRQFGQQTISSKWGSSDISDPTNESPDISKTVLLHNMKRKLQKKKKKKNVEGEQVNQVPAKIQVSRVPAESSSDAVTSTSKKRDKAFDALLHPEKVRYLKRKASKSSIKSSGKGKYKSSLKAGANDVAVQTDKKKKSKKRQKVTILDAKDFDLDQDSSSDSKKDESTQTKPKEKQD